MRVKLDYHRDGLEADLPEARLAGVVEAPAPRELPPARDILLGALRAPLGVPALRELARGRRSACVLIPDVTRPMPNAVVLPEVLGAIEQGGVPRDRVLILIATGLHRPNLGRELQEMVGPDIVRGWRIENHDARDAAAHADLGATSTGVPAAIDRRYLEAELKVALGLVEPHFMAGFSGGRKLVCPGIAAERTIFAFHGAPLIAHPRSTNLELDGNPVHATATEVARRAGVDFTLNVVLDSRRRIAAAAAGEMEAAFRAATRMAAELTTCRVPAPADIVLASAGGHPLDTTWYQAIKGVVAAARAVRQGGTILLAAGLREGIGSPDFRRLIAETADLESFLSRIEEPGWFRPEQWELQEHALAARRARVMLYSDGMPLDEQRKLHVTPVPSVEEGLCAALADHGPSARILVMPHGPYVLPVLDLPPPSGATGKL
jgi:nickel-dependent lactate racemase